MTSRVHSNPADGAPAFAGKTLAELRHLADGLEHRDIAHELEPLDDALRARWERARLRESRRKRVTLELDRDLMVRLEQAAALHHTTTDELIVRGLEAMVGMDERA